MFFTRLIFILALFSQSLLWADGQQKIVVGMHDSPVDYSAPFVVGRAWRGNGTRNGWMFARSKQFQNEFYLAQAQEELKKLWHQHGPGVVTTSFAEDIIHGTLVAELLIQGNPKLELVNVAEITVAPLIPSAGTKALPKFPSMEDWREEARIHFYEIDQAIEAAGIRVFNYSKGWNSGEVARADRSGLGLGDAAKSYFKIWNNARMKAQAFRDELIALARSNPNTIFVLSAGNTGVELGGGTIDTSDIREPNVVVVGSLDKDNRLSKFSNYSSDRVGIAALGETRLWTGTSFSAPQVANRLAEILSARPKLTSQQAIQELYLNHVENRNELRSHISQGRALKMDASQQAKVAQVGKAPLMKSCAKNFMEIY